MLSESKEDWRGVEFFLPRMAVKLWNSSLHELFVFWKGRKLFLHFPLSPWLSFWCFHKSVCALWVLISASTSLPCDVPFSVCKTAQQCCWTRGSASADGLCCGREGRVCQGRSEAVEISDECEWCDGVGKILFKGVVVFGSILLIERNCIVTGWTAGLGMSSWHKTAVWSDESPWSRQLERRRHSLCLWKTRSGLRDGHAGV